MDRDCQDKEKAIALLLILSILSILFESALLKLNRYQGFFSFTPGNSDSQAREEREART
jgi:hypothetical protein